MSTTIHAVQVIKHKNGTGSIKWFWDLAEAESVYSLEVANREDHDTIRRFRMDINDIISEIIEDAIDADEAELMDSVDGKAPEPEYTPLRYDSQSHEVLYIERTFGGEFWAYTVEKQTNNSWIVKEDGERIGRIYQDVPTALLPHYDVEVRADEAPVAAGNSLQEAVEKLIGYVSGDFT